MKAPEGAVTPIEMPQTRWFGHPPGLTILFLTEMWEMLSFIGMRVLLVYYMTRQLGMAQEQASLIYGVYAALVYFTPMVGGVISDRWLGRRRAVLIGGVTMALGHFMMTAESLFYPALLTIALGNGLFLPSLASQIEGLYTRDDPRRARAYNVYYVGVNMGAFLAPFLCGTMGEIYGWHWGFGVAGLGMLASVVIYAAGSHHLPEGGSPLTPQLSRSPMDAQVWRRLAFLGGVAAIVVVFRGAYEQIGNTMALWTAEGVNRQVTEGFSIPMTWFQAINPLVVFAGTPLLLAWWARLARRGIETPALHRMAFGAALVGLSYLLLAGVSAWSQSHGTRAHWGFLAGGFVLMTVGELYILPVGLGLFGRLAPPGLRATSMATWFFAGFFGNLLAGSLGTLWSRLPTPGFFGLISAVAGLAALQLFSMGTRMGAVERSDGSPNTQVPPQALPH